MLKHNLPPLYHSLFPSELLSSKVVETQATCENCLMSSGAARSGGDLVHYQSDLKCCTYEPYLPNYLVGALFESESTSPEAKEALRNKIKQRNISLPIGLTASVRYQVQFNRREPQDFGNRRDWLCPYYNQRLNNCGIWKYRGAVCSTFFCVSDYDKKGIQFWSNLNDYLTYVEMALMEEVLVYLDFSPRQLSDCLDYLNRHEGTFTEMKKEALPLPRAKKLWNGYYEEQESFFRKTYQMVKGFDQKQFREALGEMGMSLQENLIKSMKELS